MKSPDQRGRKDRVADGYNHLECGRKHYELRAWADSFNALSLADQETPLGAEDLELFAMAAYLVGRDGEYLKTLERAHNAHMNAGQCARAIHCAFWLGFRLLMRGEMGRASGWFARAQRLLERAARECAERGNLLLPVEARAAGPGAPTGLGAVAPRAGTLRRGRGVQPSWRQSLGN